MSPSTSLPHQLSGALSCREVTQIFSADPFSRTSGGWGGVVGGGDGCNGSRGYPATKISQTRRTEYQAYLHPSITRSLGCRSAFCTNARQLHSHFFFLCQKIQWVKNGRFVTVGKRLGGRRRQYCVTLYVLIVSEVGQC